MEAVLILCSFLFKEKGRNEIPFGKSQISYAECGAFRRSQWIDYIKVPRGGLRRLRFVSVTCRRWLLYAHLHSREGEPKVPRAVTPKTSIKTNSKKNNILRNLSSQYFFLYFCNLKGDSVPKRHYTLLIKASPAKGSFFNDSARAGEGKKCCY
jgi:hypothetical protein